MKLIHITPSYKPAFVYGGPIMSVAKLCEELEEQRKKIKGQRGRSKVQDEESKEEGTRTTEARAISDLKGNSTSDIFDLQVFTTTANGLTELSVEIDKPLLVEGVYVTYFKRWTKDHTHFSPSLLMKLNKLLRQARRDNEEVILHLHAWWNLVSVLSCLIAKFYSIPTVLSPRGMLNVYSATHNNSKIKKLFSYLVGDNLLKYCFLHLTSQKERLELPSLFDLRKSTIIPNLIDLKEINTIKAEKILSDKDLSSTQNNKELSNSTSLKLIFLSRIDKIKGLELLFKTLLLLKINWQLTVAGKGDEQYILTLKKLIHALKIQDKINWLGQVGAEKFELLARHDLLVLPSYSENFGNVVVESLSVGTPVLISEHVGLASYVKEKDLGWITNLQPKEIAENIECVANNIAKRKKIRLSAPETILKDFDGGTLINHYINFYEYVLNEHANA